MICPICERDIDTSNVTHLPDDITPELVEAAAVSHHLLRHHNFNITDLTEHEHTSWCMDAQLINQWIESGEWPQNLLHAYALRLMEGIGV